MKEPWDLYHVHHEEKGLLQALFTLHGIYVTHMCMYVMLCSPWIDQGDPRLHPALFSLLQEYKADLWSVRLPMGSQVNHCVSLS